MTNVQRPDPDDSLEREVQTLAQACLGSTATVAERLRLEQLVQENAVARRLYVHYMHDTWMLRRWAAVRSPEAGGERCAMESVGELDGWRSEQVDNAVAHFRSSGTDTTPPFLLIHTAPGAIGGALSGWPVAYLVATVIFAIGLAVSTVVPVRQPQPNAHLVSPSAPSIHRSEAECVGHVLGMVDCQWAKDAAPLHPNDAVLLGRELKLEAGLVEIGYKTGATVILQGPVTYVAESTNGGFMSVGKLTGKVEHENAKGFAVRTPTAIVTDLGTEFGVEVSKDGNTTSHVFRGVVEVHPAANTGKQQGQPVRLTENESVRVVKQQNGKQITIHRGMVDATAFVRAEQLPKLTEERRLGPFHRWQAYSQELRKDPSLLAYYDFQLKKGEPALLANVATNGNKSLDGVIENVAWVDGRMPGKHALRFNGPDDHVRINLPQKVDDLTLAVWVYVQSFDNRINGLLMGEGWFRPGQVAWQLWSDGRVQFDALRGELFSVPIFDRAQCRYRWAHLATVYDHADPCVRFYFDGQMMNEVKTQEHAPIRIGRAWIGHWNNKGLLAPSNGADRRNFHGRIDELMIFGRPLSSDEIHRMFEAGKPVSSDDTIVHTDNK